MFCKVDITSEEQVEAAFAKARAANGQERILVNCAGSGTASKTAFIDKETGEAKHFPLKDYEWTIQLNLIGTFRCIAKSAAGMILLEGQEDGERGVTSTLPRWRLKTARSARPPTAPPRQASSA